MNSFQVLKRFKQLAVIFASFLLISCLGTSSGQYRGDGELDHLHAELNSNRYQVQFNAFDGRFTYNNHRKIIQVPTTETPHYFFLRMKSKRFYSGLYHAVPYRWGGFETKQLLNAKVSLSIQTSNGT
ncbi:MAG: hypothetical protein ABEJ65_01345, partial [bacterium]